MVSILIPAFNVQEWIGDTLRSAIGQTWEPKEVIVVDDGSTIKRSRSLEDTSQSRSASSLRKTMVRLQPEIRPYLSVAETTFSGWMQMTC